MATALFLLRHVSELAVLALASYGWGRLAARSIPFRDGLEQVGFAGALGMGILASLLNMLGIAGWLAPWAILAFLLAPAAVILPKWKQLAPASISFDPSERPAVLLLGVALLVGFAFALYPPTGFDATVYHLPAAKAFSQRHRIPFLEELRFPVFPALYEMLFAAGLSLSGDVAAQLTHFASLPLTTLGLIAAGRRFSTPRSGLWAAAAWLGSPVILYLGGTAYVDAGLAMFATFSLFAWLEWRGSGDPRWLDAGAVLAGFAAGTKYFGLFLVAALPVVTVLTRSGRHPLRPAIRFTGVALLVLTPFYARIFLETGNPAFPYFSRWFGTSAWSQPFDPLAVSADALQREQRHTRIERFRHPAALALVPLRLAIPHAGFGEVPPLSPAILAVAPCLLWCAIRDRRLRPIALLILVYALVWYVFSPDKRYLLPVVPTAFLLTAGVLDGLLRRLSRGATPSRPGLAAAGIVLLLLSPGMVWAGWTLARRGPPPVTTAQRDAYLGRFVRVYPALDALNRSLGSGYTVYGLFCENAAYFARGRFLGDHFGIYRYGLVTPALGDSRRLHETLRRMGVTHLLVSEERHPVALPADEAFSSLFRPLPSPFGTRLFTLSPNPPRGPISSPPRPDPTR